MKIQFATHDMSGVADDYSAALDIATKAQVLSLPVDVSAPPNLREVVEGVLIHKPVSLKSEELVALGFYCAAIPSWLKQSRGETYTCVVSRYVYEKEEKWSVHFQEVREFGNVPS